MRAIQLVEIGKPLVEREVPLPEVGEREVLVRAMAAGICHSDVHYRAGASPVGSLPLTPGHEVAGVVERAGAAVTNVAPGDRVCIHYMLTCGQCEYCARGREQFCLRGLMLGKHADGGYAEYVAAPARSLMPLPKEIAFEHGAVLMCSSATSFHALRKARLQPGETVAVFGLGGLGLSGVQLALAMGALDVYAVDLSGEKLQLAAGYGAIPVPAGQANPVAAISEGTHGRGVDVALEVIGLPQTMHQAVQCLAIFGRAALVGIAAKPLEVDTYRELIGKEAEVIGVSDHLMSELPLLLEYARRGRLDLSRIVQRTIPLEAPAINQTLDALERFSGAVRTVIVP